MLVRNEIDYPKPQIQRVFVNDKHKAKVICPQCGLKKFIDVSKYLKIKTPLRVRCKCLWVFQIELEHRKHYRIQTHLRGTCFSGTAYFSIIVRSLSFSGIGFRIFDPQNIQLNDLVYVKFFLDDNRHSKVVAEIRVVRMDGFFIGAEFTGFKERCEKKLASYLIERF